MFVKPSAKKRNIVLGKRQFFSFKKYKQTYPYSIIINHFSLMLEASDDSTIYLFNMHT